MIDTLHLGLGALSGALVGFTLGLVGGGGSILAVPLMVYLVGVNSPHVAIGTSALAVAANAATGLLQHARDLNVRWRCGFMYAGAGIVGALAGSTLGKNFDGQKLLFLFAFDFRLSTQTQNQTNHKPRGDSSSDGKMAATKRCTSARSKHVDSPSLELFSFSFFLFFVLSLPIT